MINKINLFLFLLLPFSLIFSFFLADLTVVIIVLSFLYMVIIKKEYEYLNYRIFFLLIIWSIYLIFVSLNSADYLFSFESSLFYFRFVIFVFAINYFLSKNKNLLKNFSISLFVSFCLLIFDSYFQLFSNSNLFGYQIQEGLYGVRISSFFDEEKILGSYLSRLSPLLMGLFLIFWKLNILNSFLFIFFFLFVDSVVFISGERSAILYSLIFSCFFIFFSRKVFFLIVIKNILLIFYVFIILMTFPEINKRIFQYSNFQNDLLQKKQILDSENLVTEANNKKQISDSENLFIKANNKSNIFENFKLRDIISKSKFYVADVISFTVQHQVIYETAVKISDDYFYFGIGPKMFRKICDDEKYITRSKIDKTVNGCQTHPHNTYIQVLTECGIIGFIFITSLFLYVIYKIIFLFYRNFSKKIKYKDSLICFYICFFITLWPIVPTGNFFHNWLNIIFFLPLAFVININNKSHEIIN